MSGRLPPLPRGSTVTVGAFDGVHLGHAAVLREIARRATAAGRASVLVTFEPHPLEVVNPQAAPPLLTTDPERREQPPERRAAQRDVGPAPARQQSVRERAHGGHRSRAGA